MTPDRPSIEELLDGIFTVIDAYREIGIAYRMGGRRTPNKALDTVRSFDPAAAREALLSRFLEQQKELTPTQGRIVDEIERRVERWYDGKRVSGEDFAADIGRLIEIIRVLSPRNPWTHPAIPESEPTWVAIQPGGTPQK